jgi:signal transduction histidine kinase
MLAITEWSIANGLDFATVGMQAKIFWSKVSYIGVASVAPLWLLFTVQYTRHEHWLTRRASLLLWIIPILIIGLAATNDLHNLVWPSIIPSSDAPGAPLIYSHGIWVYVNAAYSYSLLLIGTILLIRFVLQSPSLYKQQIAAIVIGATIPWLGNIIYLGGLSPYPYLDPTPFAFTATGVLIAWGILRFHFLDIVPIAYNVLFSSMSEAVVVIDTRNRIIDLNPSARTLLNIATAVIGKKIEDILKAWPDISSGISPASFLELEITLHAPERWASVHVSPFHDSLNRFSGRLIIMQDITERKHVEEDLKRYSEHLKIINRILRHDVINYLAGVDSALMLYGKTKEENLLQEASSRVIKSVDLIRKMKDLEMLFLSKQKLRPISVKAAIEHAATHDKVIELRIEGDSEVLADDALDSVFVNIVSNAILHGKTDRIDVEIKDQGTWCVIKISDSGIGIPDTIKEKIFEEGFKYGDTGQTGLGLYIVKKIVERYGGTISVSSNVPKGTSFILKIPKSANNAQ